ncbi:hypothetical protein ACROYT_G025520 [Oculina patagonica]
MEQLPQEVLEDFKKSNFVVKWNASKFNQKSHNRLRCKEGNMFKKMLIILVLTADIFCGFDFLTDFQTRSTEGQTREKSAP